MEDLPLNPSKQVERIREILVGRQMNQVEDRLRSLEEVLASQRAAPAEAEAEAPAPPSSESSVLEETRQLRERLKQECRQRDAQFAQLSRKLDQAGQELQGASAELRQHDDQLQSHLRDHLQNVSSAMAARIDARVREILQHLQTEIAQWKHQVDRDLQSVRDETVSRTELKSRFARLASAAMEDEPPLEDGFLL